MPVCFSPALFSELATVRGSEQTQGSVAVSWPCVPEHTLEETDFRRCPGRRDAAGWSGP